MANNCGDPSLCANNCGFFGNPATNNLCSKCYKEYVMKQSKELELGGDVLCVNNKVEKNKEELRDDVQQSGVIVEGSSNSCDGNNNDDNNDNDNDNAENRASNRCNQCRKRVGLTGFKCRCGKTFCSMHRYSDKHNCVFDYKGAGQDAIARANPVVKADKIEKI